MLNVLGALFLVGGLTLTSPAPSLMPSQSMAMLNVAAPRAMLQLQIARTPSERETGLMYRTVLKAHTGMLFVFAQDAPIEFWMKNTLVPLDMVFVGANDRVRSIAANVPVVATSTPDDAIPRRRGRAEYVIELPAGEAARDGIVPGVHLSIHVPPVRE